MLSKLLVPSPNREGCGLLMAADSDIIKGLGMQAAGHIAEVVGLVGDS